MKHMIKNIITDSGRHRASGEPFIGGQRRGDLVVNSAREILLAENQKPR